MKHLACKFMGNLLVVLAVILTIATVVAAEVEYPLPLPPEVEWQDSAGATYKTIGSLQVEQITQEKLDACLKASGNNNFCQCLTGKLPVGLTFNGYIQAVTKSRQQLGYAEFSDNEKMMIDMALTVRNQCVTGTGPILAWDDEQIQAKTQLTTQKAISSIAGREEKKPAPPADTARTVAAKPASSRGYRVQVASFKSPEDALAMKSRLAKYGMEAHTNAVDLPQRGRWYRVYLGPYAKRGMAEQVKSEVQEQLQLSVWIKRDPP